ncbi:dystonin [Pelodytes ibericus]
MIAAAFLVLLRPYSIQCALLLLVLMLGTIATISFLCCWHRKLQKRHSMKTVFSNRARSRDALLRSHHFRSEGFRPSPRHLRRYTRARVEETKPPVEIKPSDHEISSPLRKRKIKRSSRVQPEFYQTVQVTPTRKPSSGTASYRCSMSSSADFSDDDDYSQKSGSASPAPGDTLPWNLPRHERCKRKTSGAAVLDPAERAVLRIADERDKVQKKTFTKWINQHLMKVRKHVGDLYEDLRDGHNLISLLEVLSGDTLPRERDFLKTLRLVSSSDACEYDQHEDLEDEDKGPREKGRMRFHRLQNVQIALDYLKKRQVKLVNIRNDDITDGNPKLTLGLIWTIILHFQISDIHVTGESEDMSAKEKLLLWTQQTTEGYGGKRCENFTTCWRDGRLFNAIIHRYRPDLVDMDTVAVQNNITNLENAFHVAEKLGVTRLLDPEDVDVSSPDEKSVITYVASMYDVFPKTPDGGEGVSASDVEVKWIEYQNMVNYLTQWIRHHVVLMSDRTFPNNAVELKALYQQYLQFKENEIPPKETEKAKIKHLYTLLEPWIEFGRVKLCQGYHPNDIEKEWGKLIIAMFEREKTLRPEIERLEMLQQIANRVQRDSLGCEDKLILARNALQADSKRMESGIQLQNEAEIAGYLIECENLLRQQLVDVQSLVDGKYQQADHLVQRVASLRDELMAIRNEYSSIYSKGRMLTADQTQLMISGISQSLNSGFSQSLNPAMNAAMNPAMNSGMGSGMGSAMSSGMGSGMGSAMSSGMGSGMATAMNSAMNSGLSHNMAPSMTPTSLTPGLSHGFNSQLSPAMTPTFAPNFNPGLIQNYASGMNANALQSLKLMQIKKPLLKSSFADQNLPEEEANIQFVQDLLSWVEEMQVQLDRAEWGSDLSSIESHLDNHRNFHGAIEEFETSVKEAKMSELQMSGSLKSNYYEAMQKLDSQYSKLMSSSRNRQKYLDSLLNFVTRATRELIWLNEKEEEEVAYDWSERNQNIPAKKDYHADLMRELDHKEEVIKSVQDIAEQMLHQNHPARSTIEAYKAAMQTQWNWILQLCHCVEQHIRQNSAYFEYFSEAKEATEYLKSLKDAVLRKYSCDKSTSLHKLEDLVQESMEEKEQLLQYKSTVAGLVGRAKGIVQLKPRNPENPLKASIAIRAICDYRQIEITIYKDDECVLASNSHRAKWKVISPTGNEAMVPAVCFTVPPPNKEAVDSANRIEQMYQSVLSLWHESHVNMKSTVSWHYLMTEIEAIRGSKVSSIKTLLPGEHQQVLSNLKARFDEFIEDSQDSKMFSMSDIGQLEREVNVCKVFYEGLLKSAEREEQEESIYNLYVSEIRNFRLRMESCEERLIRQIRTPLDRDDIHESVLRISEQEKLKKELDHLKVDLSSLSEKCEEFFSQAATSPSIETLRAELNLVIQNMNQIYSMSSIYLEKLKTINLVLKNTQGAESLVKLYETNLCEEDTITADKNSIDRLVATLKQWRSEVDEKREVFHALEDELQKAKAISDQMLKTHKERDLDFDWHKEKADQIAERWQSVHSQIENRLRDLGGISKSLKYYKESYVTLDAWIRQIEETQNRLQENLPDSSKALAKQLDQLKALISEIEMKQNKMDECQKYSEQYSSAIKDYELQLMTYRALVDSHQKSPMKRRRIQSSSDVVIQEYMDLRTRYNALMTLMTQFVKFSGDALKRMEEEEKSMEEEKKEHVKKAGEILNWVSKVSKTLSREGGQESAENTSFSKPQISSDEILRKQEDVSDALQTLQLLLVKHSDRMTGEEKREIERQVKALQDSQALLSREYERQQQEAKELLDKLVEQKVDKVVSGTIEESTGEVQSLYQSIVQGLIDYETGILLLELQLIISGLVSPDLKMCFNIEEAKDHTLIDEQMAKRLLELTDAKTCISSLSSACFPIIAALDQELITEQVAIKMIDMLLSCGCLCMPLTGEPLTLNKLLQRNLISTILFSKLIDRQKLGKDLIDPITAQKVTLVELLQRTVIDKQTGMRFLPVNSQEIGKIALKSGRKLNVLRAAHEGVLEREVLFRLLGAQIFSGGIIDPDSGRRLSLEESLEQGIVDQATICGILTQQVQNGGILCPLTGKYLTVDEAVQCNLISYSTALLVLEAQRGFIGLIWPDTSEIFPITTSLQQGMISNELAEKILSNRQKIAGLYIPETSEILTLDLAVEMSIIEDNTASVLRNLQLTDTMPNVDQLEPTSQQACKLMSSYDSHTSPFTEFNDNKCLESEEQLTHNPEHTKQLFLSYIMINSYIDANTGKRLLLFDGDLDEAASMILESEDIVRSTCTTIVETTNLTDPSKGTSVGPTAVSGTSCQITGHGLETEEQLYETIHNTEITSPSATNFNLDLKPTVENDNMGNQLVSTGANGNERPESFACCGKGQDFQFKTEDLCHKGYEQAEDLNWELFEGAHQHDGEPFVTTSAFMNDEIISESRYNAEEETNKVENNLNFVQENGVTFCDQYSTDDAVTSADRHSATKEVKPIPISDGFLNQLENAANIMSNGFNDYKGEPMIQKASAEIPEDFSKCDSEEYEEHISCTDSFLDQSDNTFGILSKSPNDDKGEHTLHQTSNENPEYVSKCDFDMEVTSSTGTFLDESKDVDTIWSNGTNFSIGEKALTRTNTVTPEEFFKFDSDIQLTPSIDPFEDQPEDAGYILPQVPNQDRVVPTLQETNTDIHESSSKLESEALRPVDTDSDGHYTPTNMENALIKHYSSGLLYSNSETGENDDYGYGGNTGDDLQSSSDYDMSDDGDDDSDNYFFGTCQPAGTLKEKETVGYTRTEDRTDSSSDEETYFNSDSNAENVVHERQFLETIIEEESENTSCSEDQALPFNDRARSKHCTSDSGAFEGDSTELTDNITFCNIIDEDKDDEFIESCFSETDIECFVTDENNSEDEYPIGEEYTNEGSRNNTINDNNLFNFAKEKTSENNITNMSTAVNSYLNSDSIGASENHSKSIDVCSAFLNHSPFQSDHAVSDSQDIQIVSTSDHSQDNTEKMQSFTGEVIRDTEVSHTTGDLQLESDFSTKHRNSKGDLILNDILPDTAYHMSEHCITEDFEKIVQEFNTNLTNYDKLEILCATEDTESPEEVAATATHIKNITTTVLDNRSLGATKETEVCNIGENLQETNIMSTEKGINAEPLTKSPIHIDNLGAIFDASNNKLPNQEISTTMAEGGSVPGPQNDTGDLTSYLRGCVGIIQTENNDGVLSNADKLSSPVHEPHNTMIGKELETGIVDVDDSVVHTFDRVADNSIPDMNISQIKTDSSEQDIVVPAMCMIGRSQSQEPCVFAVTPDIHNFNVNKDLVNQGTTETTADGKRSSFEEQQVLVPNRPKLISLQLDQIFHVPPDSENSNKFEELIINLNKGLFPSEMINFGYKSGSLEKQTHDSVNDTFCQGQVTLQSKQVTKHITQPICGDLPSNDLKSTDEKVGIINGSEKKPSTPTEVAETVECQSSDMAPAVLNRCVEKLGEHLAVIQDMKLHLESLLPISDNLETMRIQLEQLESFESRLTSFSVTLKEDVKFAEQFLTSMPENLTSARLQDLNASLLKTFGVVCEMSSDRAKRIAAGIDSEMSKLSESHEELLRRLQSLSDWIAVNKDSMCCITDISSVNIMKQRLQSLKDIGKQLSEQKIELETTAFDIQFFISEHAQDLSPNQSKQLLRLLNTTQKNFYEAQKKITSQIESLKSHLLEAQDLSDQKDAEVQLQEHKEKLEEICAVLKQTENRLIGQQDTFSVRESPTELQHYQTEYEELQKDMQAGASELAEIVKNTEKFLQEHGDKLSKEDRILIEQKLKEAKSKFELLNKKAEESKKKLEKAVTTAIKKETEKSAAVEQLEESKTKIESLLDWLSHVDQEADNGNTVKKPEIQHNGIHHKDSCKSLLGGVEEVNGNVIESDGKGNFVNVKGQAEEEDLKSQYQKVKAQHEKIVSQHKAVIIATQSAQALLEKQGRHLAPEEKEKLQRDIEELKAQYETTLHDSERKMKVIQTVQEELEKFTTDYNEFENWLQESKGELAHLESGAADFSGIMVKLKRHKSFSEDVISHKGDLRYITISGQRVLDAAKSCNKDDITENNNNINTMETCKMVQSKLDSAAENFKTLHSECNVLGNNLKDLVDKYQHYQEASSELLAGLQTSEVVVNKRLSEPIAVDTKHLQRQLEQTKVLCEQVSTQQVGVEKLKKAADVILDTKGSLLLNKDEIQKPLDEIVEKYSKLSESLNEWNGKLQTTLTRSLSVQDGLNEMLNWMESVENDLKQQQQVLLNSSAIQEIISKNNLLEQDISSRQSSINTMNEKVNTFMETADTSTASSLQAKMSGLSQRFAKAGGDTKERITLMEGLKTKVELFEDLSESVQSFLDKKLRDFSEADSHGKDVIELSLYMQETSTELLEHKKSLDNLQTLVDELCVYGVPGDKALALEKVNTMLRKYKDLEETVKIKEEDVSSCQDQMNSFQALVQSLKHWFTSVSERIPETSSTLCEEELSKQLDESKKLQAEWTSKAPDLHKVKNKGTALCNLITVVTSPAKIRTTVKTGRTAVNGAVSSDGREQMTSKELAMVQKEMSDATKGYDHLGVLLNEKVRDLEARLSQMQLIQKESNTLMKWLQKMQARAAAWETPTDTEAVQAQIEQHKLFASEVQQYESKVDALKDNLNRLLEANPDAPESHTWKEILDKIDSSWKDINRLTAERQNTLQESSNDLTQFQTAEAQLKQWLMEKELMASVLGPLSIDPNMLKTQKQQVQILLKEFDARKQQYEQLNTAGQKILSRPSDFPPCDEAVKEQLADIATKWESLTGRLNNRCNQIDNAIVKSTQYQDLMKGLSEKLSALNNKLSSNTTVGSDPDAVKQKLTTAREVQESIRQETKNIENAKVLCDELSDLVSEEYLKAQLNRQMESMVKPFMELEQKAGFHVAELQSAFASSQKFHQLSEDFQSWIGNKKKEQAEAVSISAKLDTLKSLITEQTAARKALDNKLLDYENVITEGENLLQKTEGEEKAKLQSQLSFLKSNWEDLNKRASVREQSLADCQQKAMKYKEIVENIQPWIEEYQRKLSEVKIPIDTASVENSIGQVKLLQKNADKQRGLVELLNSAADSLLNACETDKEIVTDEKAHLNKQVEMVVDNLHNKRDSLESMLVRLKDYQESIKDTDRQLTTAQEHLEIHNSLGAQAYSNKQLTIMQTQQRTLQGLQSQIDLAKRLAQEIVDDVSDADGVSDLLLQTENLQQKHNSISQEVDQKCSFLETKLQGIGHFQNSIREMFSQFAELDDELDSMLPVGRDQITLQSQKQDMTRFLKKLGDLISNNENANKTCKMMQATESSPDLIGIKRDLEALNKQCNKLLERAKSRDEQITSIVARTEEFYNTLKQFADVLNSVEEHEESQGAVGMETDVINQQLNIFTVFQKEEIEPLQARLQDVNRLGQGLIQSAAKNTSTESLEHDLEEVNTRWNTLYKKVAQRAAQLQEALLHCGRFQDALESLLSWLTDTEDLVANQKPPSAEFKVVKAQIQEQKLLQRLLDDRKPTVDVIKREREKIAGSADQADKEKILKQLSALERRWDELLKKAEIRNRQLDEILVVAEQFHNTLEPLSEWLSATEKRLANSEPIGTQTTKLLQQISQQNVLQEDITSQNKRLHQTLSIGQSLTTLSSRDDNEMVREKLDTCQTRYMEIQEKSNRRYDLLQQAHCNAQIFGDDEVELMNWLNEAHDKLSKLSVQDYSTGVLTKLHTELLLLQEDIVFRKQNVDQAIQNGLELLKQTTGDEVVIIQEKLDGIKSRYSDITKLSSEVSKVLEQALHLSTQFHSTHEELGRWLDKVEVELKKYELKDDHAEEQSSIQERKKELKQEAKTSKALLDALNEVSSGLLELVPWRARGGLDRMVMEDNERYRLVNETLTQMVEEIDAARLRSQQFEHAVGAERTWIEETLHKIMAAGHIRLEQDQTVAQLQVQKGFAMEILRHKDTIDELVASGDEIMNAFDEEEKHAMKNKLTNLVKRYDEVCHLNAERSLQLERAVSLVNQFWETYEELWPWLVETESAILHLPAPALDYDTLKQQQEDIRQLRELIAEHKPHIDKMNKTGPQLLEISPEEGFFIQEKYISADTLYCDIKEVVKKRAVALDEAISQSSQFHDKIDPTLESLERIAERLRLPPSISAECEKIREQISDNKNVSVELQKLQPVYETLKMRGEEMIARSEGADKDISAKAVQDKLDQMVFIWEDIQALTEEREAQLLDVMELAEKFWCDHIALIATIKDIQDFIRELDEPGVDPSVVKQQQEAAEAIKEEIDGLQEELDLLISLGSELTSACGEPDKPVVNKNIDELNSAWDTLNKTWKERVDKLEDAMQAAVQYQDGLQALFDWVDIAAGKIDTMSPIGTDLETVKQQIVELKQFKTDAYQQQIELERLNHQKEMLLKKVTDKNDKQAVEDSLKELRLLWQSLEGKIINRQHKLEGALLALGPFQHALDELLTWMTHTEELLSEQKPIGGDPKTIEIELAKHHVLQNDVLAHKSSVQTVQKAGNDLIESSEGEEASNLKSRLEALSQRWQKVLYKTEQRRKQLDNALFQAQGFHSEIEEMHQWLTDTERHLLASKPVGGLPETAREQLNTHLELCAAFEAKECVYKSLMLKNQQIMERCIDDPDANVDQDITNLKEKWESVETKLGEQKIKLEEALNLATGFHNSLQDFINWLTQAEQTLTMASPPSLILDTVLFQIDEHKVFVTEVNSHRDQIMELDKTGTHLKYFSQKQDVVLIKNLLISVQNRWENVVQRSLEKGRALDDARKRSKQFHEAFDKLMEWLEESEQSLDSELEIANDPDKIKTQLTMHKEFQKTLGAKHSVYDTTARSGRSLKEKASLTDDIQKLDYMLSEIRDRWDTVCGKSVERQNKLEEALLFSGQFTDALQALIDWLYRVEPQMAEDQPVHGDIDVVMNLIDNHKVFQKELGKRSSSIQALKRSARELIEGRGDDSSWVKAQIQELSTRWDSVCTLSVSKQIRLEEALSQAEGFHSAVHVLLEWLAEAEQTLRFHGLLPDDEESLRSLIEQHKEFMKKVEEKRTELNKGASMGEAILAICHPDSITTIKHWITIIRARFEEVLTWAKQHQQRLAVALEDLISKKELLESLLAWLQWAETKLNEKDKEEIPEEIDEVKALIEEHQTFMEEMTRKQPDVDKVTKTYKRKAVESASDQSQIPVLGKGRTGRKRSPTSNLYPSGTQSTLETKNPRANLLVSKWQQVWLLALERRRNLNDALDRLEELREFANFDFDIWRKKYMRWMNHKKSRVMDFFRRIDKDQDGKITRQEFIEGILSSKFPTSRLEMSAVADIFDRDGDGYIDYYEFVAALHPNKDAYKPITDADKIEDEVTRQVAKCKCAKRFQVEQIGENKYRFFLGNQFGDSQQLRLVRILRSTVMVRVGGGWMALDEFLVKNDPCRVHHHGTKMLRSESNSSITTQPLIAKGRTNMELREKFMLPEGVSQSMTPFRPKGRRSRPSSRGASPNRSNSSINIQANPSQITGTSTPKTPLHLTRNYGKPWLTNSKSSTPCKSPESPESQLSSAEGTPIQGSKLRLPGYLSGKGFQSTEDSSILTTAATKVRTQFADFRKTSRAGSKAGSRSSSRRGSDASDFEISEIQSVCSEMSELVHDSSRPSPRASSRSSTGRPSKIPTPQRRSPISKLNKPTKR